MECFYLGHSEAPLEKWSSPPLRLNTEGFILMRSASHFCFLALTHIIFSLSDDSLSLKWFVILHSHGYFLGPSIRPAADLLLDSYLLRYRMTHQHGQWKLCCLCIVQLKPDTGSSSLILPGLSSRWYLGFHTPGLEVWHSFMRMDYLPLLTSLLF
jgi:hypothetical protein